MRNLSVLLITLSLVKYCLGQVIAQGNHQWQGNLDELKPYLAVQSNLTEDAMGSVLFPLEKLIADLERKGEKTKSSLNFIKAIQKKTFRKLLKKYEGYATLTETMVNGKYDCLSSTILYSFLLKGFGFNYVAYETKFHTFIMIDLPARTILFEPTDPFEGIIYHPAQIAERLAVYKHGGETVLPADDMVLYEYDKDFMQPMVFSNLLGLQYYNLAVTSVNNQDFQKAKAQLQLALKYYKTDRILELCAVVDQLLSQNAMN